MTEGDGKNLVHNLDYKLKTVNKSKSLNLILMRWSRIWSLLMLDNQSWARANFLTSRQRQLDNVHRIAFVPRKRTKKVTARCLKRVTTKDIVRVQ